MMSCDENRITCGKTVAEWRDLVFRTLHKSKRYRSVDYSAQMLAQDLGIGGSTLSRVLGVSMGCSYTDTVNCMRVADAKTLLLKSKYSKYTVDEIGLMVGFRNRQSFFTAFAKHAGTTPQRFRDENNNK